MNERQTRRGFLRETTATGLALTSVVASDAAAVSPPRPGGFDGDWTGVPDRVWLGPEFWANPLQDWRVAGGRIECINAAPDRNVHLLTRQLGPTRGSLQMRVILGRVGGEPFGKGMGSAGFRMGIQGPLRDYRNSLV